MNNMMPLEISILEALMACIHHWKRILLSTLICGAIGVGVGYLYASNINTTVGYGVDLLPDAQLLADYTYSQKVDELEKHLEMQRIYLGWLSADKFYDRYQYELKPIEAQLDLLTAETLVTMRKTLLQGYKYPNDSKTIMLERLAEQVTQSRADMQLLLIPSIKIIDFSPVYNDMLSNARKLYLLKSGQVICQARMVEMSAMSEREVASEIKVIENQMGEIHTTLLSTKSQLEAIAAKIAEEYAVYIKAGFGVNEREPGHFSVQIVTGYYKETFANTFAAVVVISVLFGVTLGSLSAIVSCARKPKNNGEV